jgi:membrane protease YdiL (CAAX protease family)
VKVKEPMSTIESSGDSALPPRGMGLLWTFALCFVFYVVLIALCIAAVAVYAVWAATQGRPLTMDMDMFAFLLIPQTLAWVATIGLALVWPRQPWRDAVPVWPARPAIAPAIIVTSLGASILLSEIAGWIPMSEAFHRSMMEGFTDGSVIARLLVLVIVAPIAEEVFFRGIVLGQFLRRYTSTQAVWFSAIIFAVFHLNPWQAVVALPLGVWYAWMVLRTGSILPGMLSHMVVNLTAGFLFSPMGEAFGYDQVEFLELSHVPPAMLATGAALVTVGGLVAWRQITSSGSAGNPDTPADVAG